MASKLNAPDTPLYTLAEGQPVYDPTTTLQIRSRHGGGGLALLQDTQLIESVDTIDASLGMC
jgi:catalase